MERYGIKGIVKNRIWIEMEWRDGKERKQMETDEGMDWGDGKGRDGMETDEEIEGTERWNGKM